MQTVVLSALAVSIPQAVHATPSLGLDGVGTNNCQGQFCVHSQLLTTTMGDDVIIVVLECGDGNPCKVSGVIDNSGLTFVQRISYRNSDLVGNTLWEYYAITTSPLNSDNITVAAPGCCEGMQVVAIHGANTRAVFDTNPSTPATCSGTACGNCYADWNTNPGTCSASIQTSGMDFVIASTQINDAPPCGGYSYSPAGYTPPPGFTNITNQNNRFEVDYTITTTQQSNVVFNCNGTDASAIVADAISSSEHSPILINGNDAFTSDNGVTGGTGSSNDPYLISGWTIQSQDFGIEVANTTAFFTITHVTVSCGIPGQPTCLEGIVLSSIQNGVVLNSHISVQGIGVRVENSGNFQLTSNDVRSGGVDECGGAPACERWGAIFLNMSSSFNISNNSLEGGLGAINGFNLSDSSIVGNTGGGEDGITLHYLSGFLVSQNSIRAHIPIGVSSCGDLTIENNALDSPNAGIMVSNCNNVLVSNNTANVSGGEEGIWVTGSDSINVTANTLSHNTNGIRLSNFATGNTITGNLISNNQCGIQTDSTSTINQNHVADNTFAGNTQDYCSL